MPPITSAWGWFSWSRRNTRRPRRTSSAVRSWGESPSRPAPSGSSGLTRCWGLSRPQPRLRSKRMVRAAPPPATMEELEGQLGYAFRDRVWLLQALTHRSLRSREEAVAQDNERLEFLGDAILGFVVSDALCALFPHLSEGKLSRIKANLVNRRRLGQVAKRLELGRYLRLGLGEEKTGGRHKQAILANAVEALVAALYRDGGLAAARRFFELFFLPTF